MASFQRVISAKSKGHGNKMSVDGKVRGKKTPEWKFVQVAKECNGDVRKMAVELYGEEKGKLYANATKLRYEKFVKEGKDIPPMKFDVLRKHTEMTPQLQMEMIKSWQKNQGNLKKVADEIGVSGQTIWNWIQKFDKLYLEKNIAAVMEKFSCSHEEALEKLSDEEGNISFVTPLYDKQSSGQRGRTSAAIETSILEDISGDMENLLAEVEKKVEKKSELEEMISNL